MDHHQILFYHPESDTTEVWQEESGRSNGIVIRKNLMVTCEASARSIAKYDLFEGPGSREVLVSTYLGDSLGSPNDIAIVGDRLYFSEFWIAGFHRTSGANRQIFRNRVYSWSLEHKTMDTLAFNFETPNGVAASPDGTLLYVGDIAKNMVYRASVADGIAGEVEPFVDLAPLGLQGPDGMAVAGDGRIFLALFRSGCLLVLNPDGTPIGTLPTGTLTTNCVFASDGKTLYITADHKLKRVVVPKPSSP